MAAIRSSSRSRSALSSSSTPSNNAVTPVPSKMPCADFITTGFCKYGDRCLFTHEVTTAGWASKARSHSSTPPPLKSRPFDAIMLHNPIPSPPSSSKTSPSVQSVSLHDAEVDDPVHTMRRQPRQRRFPKKPRQYQQPFIPSGMPTYYPHPHPQPVYLQPVPFFYVPVYQPPPLPYTMPPAYPSVNVESLILKEDDSASSVTPSEKQRSSLPAPSARPGSFSGSAQDGTETVSTPDAIAVHDLVYDFDDDKDGSEQQVVVEAHHVVSHYEGLNVGVLGGGVKLGVSAPLKHKATPLKASDVVTMDALAFDSDDEEDTADPLDPVNIELPPSPPDTEDESQSSSIRNMTVDTTLSPTSTTAFSLPSASAFTTFSWADDEDDSSFFDGPPTFGSDHLEVVPEAQEPESFVQPAPVGTSKPKPFSYASAVSGKVVPPRPASTPCHTPSSSVSTSIPSLPYGGSTPKPSFASIVGAAAASRSLSCTRGSDSGAWTGKETEVSTSEETSPKKPRRRQRNRYRNATTIKDAPHLYNKLGFVLSPSAAREVEHLRLLAQRQLQAGITLPH